MSRKRLFTVEMGGWVKEGGKTFYRYTVNGPSGEVMRGVRAGKKDEVKRYAQRFADKLEADARPGKFRVGKAA